jgi:hypothetical protein
VYAGDVLRVTFRRVRPDQVDRLRAWMAELMRRQDEVLATFANEGVRHEQAFLLQTTDGPVLVYAAEADDFLRAAQAYAQSTLPIDLEHRQVLGEVLAGDAPVERVYEAAWPAGQAPDPQAG